MRLLRFLVVGVAVGNFIVSFAMMTVNDPGTPKALYGVVLHLSVPLWLLVFLVAEKRS